MCNDIANSISINVFSSFIIFLLFIKSNYIFSLSSWRISTKRRRTIEDSKEEMKTMVCQFNKLVFQ